MATPTRHRFSASRQGYLADGFAFDDRAYLAANADVRDVVERGVLCSGLEHYHVYGRWEGRAYPVRGGLLGVLAGFLLWCEALIRWLWTRFDPSDLASRLLADGVHPRRPLAGPKGMSNYRGGPWRGELPFFASGYAVMDILIESPAESTRWVAQPLKIDGTPVGEAQAFDCKSSRHTKRVLRIPSAARRMEWRQRDSRVAWIGELKLRPLSERMALRMLERRLARPESGVPNLSRSQTLSTLHPDGLWSAYQHTFPLLGPPGYDWWVQRLEGPRMRAIDEALQERFELLPDRLLFSVLVPVFDPEIELLRSCLDSIVAQSYPTWEACLVDDASTNPNVREVLEEYAARDSRFRTHFRRQNGHISRTSQDALEMARGDFVVLLDHDDELARHALLLMAEALRDHPQAVLLYSDEDKLDESGVRCDPHFKPDFDVDRLLGHNYIAHLLVARRSEVLARGGFRTGMEGSQDHDLVLRMVANQPADKIVHVPEILYHWRKHARSTAQQLDSKPYALEAGRRAVLSHLASGRHDARVELDQPGQCLRVRWAIPVNPPRVSIIVPTRDGFPLLSRSVRTLLDDTDYPNFEVVVVDNGSRDTATLRYLDHIRHDDERVIVLRCDDALNALALNNVAAAKSTGLVLAFVSEGIQPVDSGWLREMVSHAIRPGVGAVGAKLLHPDGRVRHGGVVLDVDRIAGPAFESSPGTDYGYFSKLRIAHTVSAVTGACMVVERRKFESIGRFDAEGLAAFGDVDLCLRLSGSGYRTVLTPHAILTHRDAVSIGSSNEDEHLAPERQLMRERWGSQLRNDPYYSPHLNSALADYGLRAE